jgi:hypothetical protein
VKSISILDVQVFPCSPINLTLAVLQHFHSISRGLAVPGIIVLGKAPDNVAKFVKQNGDSSLRRVSIIKTYLQPVPAGRMPPADSVTRDCRKKNGPLAFKEMMELLPALSVDFVPQGCLKDVTPSSPRTLSM